MSDGATREHAMRRWKLSLLLSIAGAWAAYPLVTAQPRRHGASAASSGERPRAPVDASAPAPDATVTRADASVTRAPRERSGARAERPRPLLRAVPSPTQSQRCVTLTHGDRDGRWVHPDDVLPPLGFVDGDDLLTIVNRSPRFVLSPDYAPDDLIEIETGEPHTADECTPAHRHCLRREAAESLRLMLESMAATGHVGHVHSAFRSFGRQCEVFRGWSRSTGQDFCRATTSSAIAGHSQHQLGTAIDLFTRDWANRGEMMRAGFGCTPAGRWIAEHAWEFGYVLPYPMPLAERVQGSICRHHGAEGPIDPRTGYRYEPWHLRFIGVEAAARFHRAWAASGPDTARELTLEQWLRQERGVDADVDLPVCDGCACGLCTTFHDGAPPPTPSPSAGARTRPATPRPTGPCGDRALLIGPDGEPARAASSPRIEQVQARRESMGVRVIVTLSVPGRTVTQTPVTSRAGASYRPDATYTAVAPSTRVGALPRAYPDLRGAWRLALAPRSGDAWPWRAALRSTSTPAWVNGANLRLPTLQGITTVEVIVPPVGDVVRVALMRDGRVEGPVRETLIR